jgi:two-component system sensor histidine kinase RegB
MDRIGEPYLTTRARTSDDRADHEAGGLGLGVFIAKTLLERTGGRLAFENIAPEGHARVRIVWPRNAVEGEA